MITMLVQKKLAFPPQVVYLALSFAMTTMNAQLIDVIAHKDVFFLLSLVTTTMLAPMIRVILILDVFSLLSCVPL
jgi:hypothetical protein